MDTPGGYAMWKLGVILTFPAIWGLLAGSRILRGEEERGSLDMLLSLPRSRGRAAVEKVAALGTALLLMGLLIGVLTAWGGARANAGFSFGDALLFGLNVALISAVFAAIALFISQFTHERSTAAGLTGALFGLAILLNSLAHIAPDTEGLAHISPVYLFALSKPLIPGHGVDPVAMLALAGISLAFTALGVTLFLAARCRRDHRAASVCARGVERLGGARARTAVRRSHVAFSVRPQPARAGWPDALVGVWRSPSSARCSPSWRGRPSRASRARSKGRLMSRSSIHSLAAVR